MIGDGRKSADRWLAARCRATSTLGCVADPPIDDVQVTVAVRAAARVGEGPVWDAQMRRLLWVDIPAGFVHSSSIDTGETTTARLPTQVGAVAPSATGGLVVACQEGFGFVADEGRFEVRRPVLRDGERMNDAKCDAAGRFWAGSTAMDFDAGRGALHVLRPDWSTDILLDGLTLPNGMGWSPDSRTFYLTDTVAHAIYAFDFDLARAALSARRTLIEFAEPDGMPDGLCVDSDGWLWVAMWGGGRVLRVSPAGEIRTEIALPVRQPSSCAFAGAELDLLCVTSASDGLDLDDNALDGSVFRVSGTGSAGLPQAGFGLSAR
jgi:sugar lactone lactonase YvrE